MEQDEVAMTVSLKPQTDNEILSTPIIVVICVIVYLVLVALIWLLRKCLMNQGMCKECQLHCDCCLCLRDCCIGCGTCCQDCSVNNCMEGLNCHRQKYYCVDLMCCRCLCPDDSPCVNCCQDMASGSCECCGLSLNFSMAQTARSPRQMANQQPGYPPMYPPSSNQPLGTHMQPYVPAGPQGAMFNSAQSGHLLMGTYPPVVTTQGGVGQLPPRPAIRS